MIPEIRNLLAPSQSAERSAAEETFPLLNLPNLPNLSNLPKGSGIRLEQIVSHGQASPPGFWYDQPQNEWVVLLKGTATLAFKESAREGMLDLVAGDSLTIPARLRHRVANVSHDAVWLALHFGSHA